MSKQVISLHGYNGMSFATWGIVRGVLALHPDIMREEWSITHLPSGCQFARFTFCSVARKAFREAAQLAWPTEPPTQVQRDGMEHDEAFAWRSYLGPLFEQARDLRDEYEALELF